MNQYAIIVVPSLEISEKVDAYRKKYARYTDYVIVPHFTIYPPFFINSNNEKEIIQLLKESFRGIEPWTVKLEKIGYFEGKNSVVFFEPNNDSSIFLKKLLVKATKTLKDKVKNVYDDYNFSPEKFKPHMTIAEKIPADIFESVKNELKDLEEKGSFSVSSIFLYGQKEKSNLWGKIEEITF